jgi:hypothetical protein
MTYLTIADAFRENGWRHMTRGYAHRAAGREEWAKGSFAKAHRNFERAKILDGIGVAGMREQIQALADNVGATILYGR